MTTAADRQHWGPDYDVLRRTDPEIAEAIANEIDRKQETLQLIASENFTSPAVLAAQGSVMSDKYAEGYPGRRYYGGCEFVDVAESLAIERVKSLFGAEHANVQPHSGAQANMAAYYALGVTNGDTVMAMSLAHGGHLTHGSPVNFSGKWFNIVGYGVSPDDELIDLDEVRKLANEHRPKVIVAGFTAYPRHVDFEIFRKIADEVGATLMVDAAHVAGLVAGDVHPSPVPYADIVTFTTHKTLRGPRGGAILCRADLAKKVDKAVFPLLQGGPQMHAIAGKAVAFREAQQSAYAEYAGAVVDNAQELATGLADEGLRIVSGGTDIHYVLADVTPLGLTGTDAEQRCEAAGIALNKNAIPFDQNPPMVASGVRVGTPSLTTQGMGRAEIREVTALIGRALRGEDTTAIREDVRALAVRHPIYGLEPTTT
jgi:glycine hydroxymethyltransferase